MLYKLYEAGGHVRDFLLGIESKDIDYSVVLENPDLYNPGLAFNIFVTDIKKKGYEVFLETPGCLTVRAKFPKGSINEGLVADFVLSRNETSYINGTRTPKVVLGTLEDDIMRRDFTVNSLFRDMDGNIIDMVGGQSDLINRILRTNSDAAVSINQDPLRILRAIRFCISKGLMMSDELITAIKMYQGNFEVVSEERILAELTKMFKYSTKNTLDWLSTLREWNPRLYYDMIGGTNIWLMPTNKNK